MSSFSQNMFPKSQNQMRKYHCAHIARPHRQIQSVAEFAARKSGDNRCRTLTSRGNQPFSYQPRSSWIIAWLGGLQGHCQRIEFTGRGCVSGRRTSAISFERRPVEKRNRPSLYPCIPRTTAGPTQLSAIFDRAQKVKSLQNCRFNFPAARQGCFCLNKEAINENDQNQNRRSNL